MTPRRFVVHVLFAALVVSAGAQTKVPPGEDLLGGQGVNALGLQLFPGTFDAVNVKVIPVDGAPGFSEALHFEASRDLNRSFSVQLRGFIRSPMRKGDTGLVRFFARTISSADESGAGRIGASIRRGTGFGR